MSLAQDKMIHQGEGVELPKHMIADPYGPAHTQAIDGKLISEPVAVPYTKPQPEQCCNVQWVLFVLGLFFSPFEFVGVLLPLCTNPRFPTRCYKSGWIANTVLASIRIAFGIAILILYYVNRSHHHFHAYAPALYAPAPYAPAPYAVAPQPRF